MGLSVKPRTWAFFWLTVQPATFHCYLGSTPSQKTNFHLKVCYPEQSHQGRSIRQMAVWPWEIRVRWREKKKYQNQINEDENATRSSWLLSVFAVLCTTGYLFSSRDIIGMWQLSNTLHNYFFLLQVLLIALLLSLTLILPCTSFLPLLCHFLCGSFGEHLEL